MIKEQDKRVIETMAQCGCEVDSLCAMFPNVAKEDIISIWNEVVNAKDKMDDSSAGNISINCS